MFSEGDPYILSNDSNIIYFSDFDTHNLYFFVSAMMDLLEDL